MTESWQVYLNENQERFLSEYLELLRIPSISTDPDYAGDVRKAAEWVVGKLEKAGIEKAGTLETAGHPVVYGEWLHAPGQPTVLIYGHFDVQPAVPVSLWNSPPFEPVVKDGKVYGRAASDMKGNLLLPIIACETLLKTNGSLPVNLKFLFEGEEEIGSKSLNAFIKEHIDLLACDTVISADGGCGSEEEPSVTTGVRGIFSMQLNVKTANMDMHSGAGGGIAPNAIHELVRILNSMRDEEGHILVEGFYGQVKELTSKEKEQIAKSSSFTETLKKTTGFKEFYGEPEYTPMERGVGRPTLEINGIWGGYQGAGGKTVIPCEAHAKITTRLVPDQTPDQVRELLTEHIKKQAVRSIEVTIENGHGANPYRVPQDYPQLLTLKKVLEKATGHAVRHQLSGGSVPVMSLFKDLLGAETLTLGAAMDDERAHAPNEFYRLSNFERVQKIYCLLLQEMGR